MGGQVVAEIKKFGATWWGLSRGYIYGAGGELLAVQYEGVVRWVHQDPATKSQRFTDTAGSVTAKIDLDPWGGETNRSVNSSQQARKYTTYERDSDSTDEAMMRRYRGAWARFDQPDPYDGAYDLTDPQSLNRYAYVGNDPVNFVDPTGLQKMVPCFNVDTQTWTLCPDDPPDVYIDAWAPTWREWEAQFYLRFALNSRFGGFWGGGGGGSGVTQNLKKLKEVTDCDLFAAEVARIAFGMKDAVRDESFPAHVANFADALRDRFAKEGYDRANTEFGSSGFKGQFQDPDPTSASQARHYVGAFRASVVGGILGEAWLNGRERSGRNDSDVTRQSHQADLALNSIAFRHARMLKTGQAWITDLQRMILKDVCE